jgi:hypothetical protein
MSEKVKTKQDYKKDWGERCAKHLVGKTIKKVGYLTEKEKESMYWHTTSLVIEFTDGSYIFPMTDDEGNGAGALATSFEGLETIPVI